MKDDTLQLTFKSSVESSLKQVVYVIPDAQTGDFSNVVEFANTTIICKVIQML